MPEYTLTYFDTRGWAEPARQILSYGGASWKDNRIPFVAPGATPIPDDIKARAPYGAVPILEFDGTVIAQSNAINRYLAREFKLTGKNEIEAAKADEIVDAVTEFTLSFLPFIREQDATKKEEGLKAAAKQTKEKFLTKFNEYAQANGGYLVGNSLTWADIIVANSCDALQRFAKVDLAVSFPALKQVVDNVFNAPGIKEWIAKRPETLL